MKSTSVRSWRLHGILLGLGLLKLVVWFAFHQTTAELEGRWRSGTGPQRLGAAHALLNRADASPVFLEGRSAGKALLADRDPRVRTLAFTSDVCKLAPPTPQLSAVIEGLERGTPAAFVDFVLQCRKVGGQSVGSSNAMKRRELDWYFAARRSPSWPGDEAAEIDSHLAPWLESIDAYLRRN